MAKGLFIVGFTVQDILDILAKAKANLKAGVIMTSYSASGVNTGKQIVAPTLEIVDECTHALTVLDPVRFPAKRVAITPRFRVDL